MTILGPWNVLFTSPARFKTSSSWTLAFHQVESMVSWLVDADADDVEERSGVNLSLVRRTKYSRKL